MPNDSAISSAEGQRDSLSARFDALGLHTAGLLRPGKKSGVPGNESLLLEDDEEHDELIDKPDGGLQMGEGMPLRKPVGRNEEKTCGRGTRKGELPDLRVSDDNGGDGGKGCETRPRPRADGPFGTHRFGSLRNASLGSETVI